MFDLSLNEVSTPVISPGRSTATCLLFYRHEPIRDQLEEAIHFHGMGDHGMGNVHGVKYDGDNLGDILRDTDGDAGYSLMLIEMGDATVEQVTRWRHRIAHDMPVVLVSQDDSILTMRAVENLGFYYLLWPADTDMIGETLDQIREDQLHHRGPQQVRSAMRTAVVGPKGGCGCTLVAAELAHVLAAESGKQVILVDHNYQQSAMSVMLGRHSLERQRLSEGSQGGNAMARVFDLLEAQNQLFRIDDSISYLGLEAQANGEELLEYNHQLLESLAREANFIIEDYSASVNFSVNPAWLCQLMDWVVVVVEPCLSSLVQTRPFLERLQLLNQSQSHPARILLVVNHTRPGSTVDKATVEKYLDYPVAFELPWEKGCEERLAENKRFYNSATRLAMPFQNLGRMLLGKSKRQQPLFDRLKAMLELR